MVYRLAVDILNTFPNHVQSILDISSDFILASCSTSTKTPSLELIDLKTGSFKRIELKEPLPVYEPEPARAFVPHSINPDASTPPSILVEPSNRDSYPLIVVPHGGPHGVLQDSFDHETAYFTKLGSQCIIKCTAIVVLN